VTLLGSSGSALDPTDAENLAKGVTGLAGNTLKAGKLSQEAEQEEEEALSKQSGPKADILRRRRKRRSAGKTAKETQVICVCYKISSYYV